MSKPKIADRKPIKVELSKGDEQFWCACGLSSNQPYCDDSHRTTDITPVKFVAEETGDAYLCMCKHTKNPPYCDGTHATLKEESNTSEVQAPVSSGSTKEEPVKFQVTTPKNLKPVSKTSGNTNLFDSKLVVGNLVKHIRFGTGEVLKIEGTGADVKAEIKFENGIFYYKKENLQVICNMTEEVKNYNFSGELLITNSKFKENALNPLQIVVLK